MLRRSTRSFKKPPVKTTSSKEEDIEDEESEELEDPYACDSDDDFIPSPKKGKKSGKAASSKYSTESSSSESDIDDYLQPADKIDLNSSFFKSNDEPSFENIEKKIFTGITVTRLSESDSSSDSEVDKPLKPVYTKKKRTTNYSSIENKEEIRKSLKEGETVAKLNFQKLQDYRRQLEEAKISVEQYKAKQAQNVGKEVKTEEKININDLLAIGESRKTQNQSELHLNSSSYDSCSEEEDWEEIKSKQEYNERSLLPKKELEITLEMPGPIRKKKGDDLLAAVKRRLNRIRKENQLLIHKVHLLCWIAHGNYVNSTLNNPTMMALGLSMIPSVKSFPSGRIDLKYLEQILKWYKKTVTLNEKVPSKTKSLSQLLIEQIDKKEAYTKKILVFSLQVESLRPPNTDLHSLAKTKTDLKLKKEPVKNSGEASSSNKKIESLAKTAISHLAKSAKNEKSENLIKSSKSSSSVGKKSAKATEEKTQQEVKLSKPIKTEQDTKSSKRNDESVRQKAQSSAKDKPRIEITKNGSDTEKRTRSSRISKKNDESAPENVESSAKTTKVESQSEENQIKTADAEKKSRSSRSSKRNDESAPEKVGRSTNAPKDGAQNERKQNKATKNEVVAEKKTRSRKKDETLPEKVESEVRNSRNIKSSEKGNEKEENSETKSVVDEKKQDLKQTENPEIKEKSEIRSTKSKSQKVTSQVEKPEGPEKTRATRSKSKSLAVDDGSSRSRSACSMTLKLEKINENYNKIRSKSSSSATEKSKTSKDKQIMQLDGSDDGLEEFKGFKRGENSLNINFEKFYSQMYGQISENIRARSLKKIPQLDGVSDEPSPSKPNLKKLKEPRNVYSSDCKSRRHTSTTKKVHLDRSISDSDGDFEGSPSKKLKKNKEEKNSQSSPSKSSSDDKEKKKINFSKLKDVKSKNDSATKDSPKKVMDVKNDIMQLIKGRISEQKQVNRSKIVRKRKPAKTEIESDDSDYAPEAIKKKHHSESDDEFYPKMKVKQRIQVKKEVEKIKKLKKPKNANSRKVISSDSEYTEEDVVNKKSQDKENVKKKRGNDTWLEVFLETEEKWMSVDVIFGQVHCVNELFSRASHPVSYILAWDNNSFIKDVTRRYCQNFNTVTRKLRTDSQWWEASLKPFLGPKTARDKEEDEELDRQQLEKPLPTTISEYKNHPLYALERHLLKFEALYPPNAPPLGFVRNEPVYSRDCVHVCHSREIWLKDAKVVRRGEKPYKIVKARPKYDKLSNTMITDQMLEIFGPWQVEEYEPPTAENGIVPRNAYGNVDLFKPSMLPKKCVHLRLPGLNKVAKKMNIDCSTAIVGFDFHGGFSHPVVDGFVVCEEYEDQLVAAWNIEQEEMERKEQEKYEARVYGNWKKLIKGLIIKQKLKAKYGFGEEKTEEVGSSNVGGGKRKSKGPTFCTKKRRVISDSESEDDKK